MNRQNAVDAARSVNPRGIQNLYQDVRQAGPDDMDVEKDYPLLPPPDTDPSPLNTVPPDTDPSAMDTTGGGKRGKSRKRTKSKRKGRKSRKRIKSKRNCGKNKQKSRKSRGNKSRKGKRKSRKC